MFKFFWGMQSSYASEESFECLFRLLARREQSDWVGYFLRSRATWTVFLDMSYSYRPEFIEHLL